jgi:hypothetical protein
MYGVDRAPIPPWDAGVSNQIAADKMTELVLPKGRTL